MVDAWRPALLLLPRGLLGWEVREALSLLGSAGYVVEDIIYYRRVSHGRLLSEAKLREVAERASRLRGNDNARIVVFDDIKPRDYFRLVEAARVDVIDRTLLILEIFALHAGSREALYQIELARLRHRLPLVREAIRLAKMGELPGFLGPGGYAIDSYYRHMVSRIARIRRELKRLAARRALERAKRKSTGIPHVAIVGYASAGKTSLFNRLTGLSKPVGPEYFTTVSPKVRAVTLNGLKIAFVDTVGFISRIPPEIVEAFHSTLEEAVHANMLLFVVDASERQEVIVDKVAEALRTLSRIGAVGRPMIIAANKIDLVPERNVDRIVGLLEDVTSGAYPWLKAVVPISAKAGDGIEWLKRVIVASLKATGKCMC